MLILRFPDDAFKPVNPRASLDPAGLTPLYKALIDKKHYSLKLVERLLDAGAEVKGHSGSLALHASVSREDPKVILLLLQYGIDINLTDDCKRLLLEHIVCELNGVLFIKPPYNPIYYGYTYDSPLYQRYGIAHLIRYIRLLLEADAYTDRKYYDTGLSIIERLQKLVKDVEDNEEQSVVDQVKSLVKYMKELPLPLKNLCRDVIRDNVRKSCVRLGSAITPATFKTRV